MYIHLGNNAIVRTEEIIGIFDLDNTTVSARTRDYLKKARKDDSFSGVTSIGPHRDDIELLLGGVSARQYASQVQKRSIAITLKLACLNVIFEVSGEYPVCLLDDVMSELDESRQNYILNHVSGWQTFITCCDPSSVTRLLCGGVFRIKDGGVF